jgi:DNA-binding GntR family transcriptional regulator
MNKSTPRFPEVAAGSAPPTDAQAFPAGIALGPRPSASRMIADALRLAIVEGTLQPGTPLRQDAVARRFSVSAIPVREALRQLESEGWVKSEANKGATVSPLVADEAREIYEMRAALESLAIGLAIEHHTSASLQLAAACLKAAVDADEALYVAHNQAFHLSLYAPAGRPRLLSLIETLHRRGERYLRLKLDVPSRKAESDQEHAALLKAVKRRDVAAAQALITAHLLNTGELLYRFLTDKQAAEAPQKKVRRTHAKAAADTATGSSH